MDSYVIMERLLVDLHIISQLRPGQKLITQQGKLQIQRFEPTWLNRCRYSIARYWYGESRDHMLSYIKKVVEQTLHLLNLQPTDPIDRKQVWYHETLLSALQKARQGLTHLKETYAMDAAMVAEMDVLLLSVDHPLSSHE